MDVLLSEPDIRKYYTSYAEFLDSTFRFYVSCALQPNKRLEDYLQWFNDLEAAFERLTEGLSFGEASLFRGCLSRMKLLAQRSKSVEEVAVGCENLVRHFLFSDQDRFRNSYLDACAKRALSETYSKDLAFVLLDHLEKGDYDKAITAAFICLDQHLQRVLSLPPSEYGQALIDKAFSPKSGRLKLQAHDNEQRGLHNLASGAYAFFRNAVAHRTVFQPDLQTLSQALAGAIGSGDWSNYPPNKRFYDSMTAETAIALVALLLKITTILAVENGLVKTDQAITSPFGRASRREGTEAGFRNGRPQG
jgi:uncharacterized protein (TIGR02391 family)